MNVRIIVFLWIMLFGLQAAAQASLINVNPLNLDYNKYKITFTLSKQAKFKVIPLVDQHKIVIEFFDSKFAIKTLANKKLDPKFIKNLRKSKNNNNLKITLELDQNAVLDKNYSIVKNKQLFMSLELKNHQLKPKENKALLTKKTVIMIDPGHGGADSGTIGSRADLFEKNIALAYAKELKKELSKYPQYKVILTRDKDETISLTERKNKARKYKADIFISLHADANEDSKMKGASVYTLSNEALDAESTSLSERENKEDILKNDQLLKHNQEIANALIDMVYHDTKNASIKLAEATAEELGKEINMMHKFHRSAGFKVLKGVDIPAILIEIGYLSNQEEEKLLTSYIHKKIFARAMVRGIDGYFSSKKNIIN